jgi:hypothetical protein
VEYVGIVSSVTTGRLLKINGNLHQLRLDSGLYLGRGGKYFEVSAPAYSRVSTGVRLAKH